MMRAMKNDSVALLVAISSSILGGTAFVASRYAVAESDPMTVAFLRAVGAGAAFAFCAWGLPGRRPARFARADLLPIFLLGVLMFAVFGWLFATGTRYIPAARAALILSLMPVIALALAAVTGMERLSATKIAACVLAAFGVAVALGDRAAGGPEAWKGDLVMLLGACIGASHTVISARYLRRYKPMPLTAVQYLAGLAALGAALLVRGDFSGFGNFSPAGWFAIFWMALPAGFLAYFLWFYALTRIPASRVTLCVTLNPIAAAACGALILGEAVDWRLGAGLACIAGAILLAGRRKPNAG
jgi:drug/metabolite transporter (DMT)-like permease